MRKALSRNVAFVAALVRIRLTKKIADAPSFWTGFFVDTAVFAVQALVFWIIYLNADAPNGWDRWRSIFFVGTFTVIDGIYMTLYFFGVRRIPDAIRTGELDLYLTRPVSPLMAISFGSADPGSALVVAPGLVLIGISTVNIGVVVTPLSVLSWSTAVLLMLVLMFDLMLLWQLPAFRLKRTTAFGLLENSLVAFSFRVPGYAYAGVSRVVFRVLVPYGLIATFPTEVFLSGARTVAWLEVLPVVVVFTVLAVFAWKRGLSMYASTGT
jgi:ABC-2 type transport system permease protein